MRRLLPTGAGLAAGLALVLVAVGLPAEAAPADEEHGLTVTATESVHAPPDTATWTFGVQARRAEASAALRTANRRMRAVVAAVRGAGVAREDIRTEAVSLYTGMDEESGEPRGYVASTTVTALVRALGKAGAIAEAAVGAGATDVYGPSMTRSDQDALYQQALGGAYERARAKAQRLAQRMGVALGRPLTVVEGGGGAPGPLAAAAEGGEDMAIEPGRSEIAATITVTFAIA